MPSFANEPPNSNANDEPPVIPIIASDDRILSAASSSLKAPSHSNGTDKTILSSETKPKKGGCFRTGSFSWPCVKAFLLKHFLVIGLINAIWFSLACPWPGRAVNSVAVGSWRVFPTINIITIFIISGLTLKTEHIKDAIRRWGAALVGVISIMLITPCAGFVLVQLPFNPPSYKYGLAIFALVPTTIASGITLVTAARGNAALALMLTVVTNVLAVFILPFTVPLVISSTDAASINLKPADMLIKLVMTILLPLLIGKALREISSWIRNMVTKYKTALGLLNNGSLICIVWQTLSAAQQNVVHTAFGTLCLIFLAAILLHVAYLIVNFIIVKLLHFPHREAVAVLIMASEKTLPMAVTVIASLPESLGSKGELTVPCVLAHISQVLIDAFLCEKMGSKEKARSEAILLKEKEAAEQAADIERAATQEESALAGNAESQSAALDKNMDYEDSEKGNSEKGSTK